MLESLIDERQQFKFKLSMANVTEDKKLSRKKFFRAAGLVFLTALAGLAIYDHRDQIVSCAKKSASKAKTFSMNVKKVFTNNNK